MNLARGLVPPDHSSKSPSILPLLLQIRLLRPEVQRGRDRPCPSAVSPPSTDLHLSIGIDQPKESRHKRPRAIAIPHISPTTHRLVLTKPQQTRCGILQHDPKPLPPPPPKPYPTRPPPPSFRQYAIPAAVRCYFLGITLMGPMLTSLSTSDEALNEAQRVDLVPELCTVNGAFIRLSQTCITCLEENSLDVIGVLREFIGPEGVSAFNYCGTVPTQFTTTITALGLDGITTVRTLTVVGDLLPLASESSSLASGSQTTPADGPVTDPATGENGMYKPRPVLGTSARAAANFQFNRAQFFRELRRHASMDRRSGDWCRRGARCPCRSLHTLCPETEAIPE
jgi:hypothetical protein